MRAVSNAPFQLPRPSYGEKTPFAVQPSGLRFSADEPKDTPPPSSPPPSSERTFSAWEMAIAKPLSALVGTLLSQPKVLTTAKDTYSPLRGKFESCLLQEEDLHHFGPITPLSFKSVDGLKLQGYWMPATDTTATKTIILGHGFTDDWRTMAQLGHTLRQKGYNAFLFDFRAHGKSEGTCKLGLEEGRDIAGAVNFLSETLPYRDKAKHLFYMGHSMGASSILLAPKSLGNTPEDLKKLTQRLTGMVLDSPFNSLSPKNIKSLNASVENSVPALLKSTARYLTDLTAARLVQDAEAYLGEPLDSVKPADTLKAHPLSKKPILLIHGTADPVTPFDHANTLYNTLKGSGSPIERLDLENGQHFGFSQVPGSATKTFMTVQRGGPTYPDRVLQFLNTHSTETPITFKGVSPQPRKTVPC